MSQPYPSKLSTSVEHTVAEAERNYGLCLKLVSEPHFGYNSTILRLQSSDEAVVLKVFGSDTERGSVQFSAHLQVRLHALGLPVVVPKERLDGQWYGDVAGRLAVLYPRAEGSVYRGADRHQLYEAGRTLARIHALTTTDFRDLSGLAPDTWHGPVGHPCLVHGDFRAQNLLFSSDRVSCVLDWDDAGVGDAFADLGYAIVFFQAAILDAPPTAAEMVSLVNGYVSRSPMDSSDLALLSDVLPVALHKGLRLWRKIVDTTPDSATRTRVSAWIDAYAPLEAWLPTLPERISPR